MYGFGKFLYPILITSLLISSLLFPLDKLLLGRVLLSLMERHMAAYYCSLFGFIVKGVDPYNIQSFQDCVGASRKEVLYLCYRHQRDMLRGIPIHGKSPNSVACSRAWSNRVRIAGGLCNFFKIRRGFFRRPFQHEMLYMRSCFGSKLPVNRWFEVYVRVDCVSGEGFEIYLNVRCLFCPRDPIGMSSAESLASLSTRCSLNDIAHGSRSESYLAGSSSDGKLLFQVGDHVKIVNTNSKRLLGRCGKVQGVTIEGNKQVALIILDKHFTVKLPVTAVVLEK